jgi:uncharacterized coiled-coil protein SlyX
MADVVLEQRMTKLEEAMEELAQTVARTSASVDRLSREMREFKDEMREFKEETGANWARRDAELQAYQREWRAEFETYQRAWRAEFESHREKSEADLQAYRAEQQAMRREFNQQQGEIANKLGTLAEDLVVPSLPRILTEVVPCPGRDQVSMAVRVRRSHPTERGQSQEYDVIVSCGDYALFNETKSRLRPGDVDRLIERLEQARGYFPEYEDRKILGSLASLYVDPSLVRYASRQGVLVLATGDELMEVLNEPGLALREF